ncbi:MULTISPECIES: sensor histidine kinase [unclassified Spirillospora]|uniref:sensor histidine kinase n=1 Tax=unclassified Spirillospora TaxID=2642701 RepID=UPI00371CD53B
MRDRLAWWRLRARPKIAWVAWIAGSVAAVSTTATAAVIVYRPALADTARTEATVEAMALLTLIAIVVRVAPRRQAIVSGALLGVAVSVWVWRFGDPDPASHPLQAVAWNALWAMFAVGAALIGGCLRWTDARRRRTLAHSHQAVRLEIARDLHDFVAHDISVIVLQAQATRFVADQDHDLGQALAALERIEVAGLRALASMDRTVHMLHESDARTPTSTAVPGNAPAHAPLPGLTDLSELAEQFSAPGTAAVRLDLAPDLAASLPGDLSATAYRIVAEALTNVRRHAPTATTVTTTVRPSGGSALEVTVTNDGTSAVRASVPRADRHGGFGLAGLTERVQALGGTLTAGPYSAQRGGAALDGWRVTALLPLTTSDSAIR